jgi:lipopolysaccharide export system protein LptA
MRPSRVIDASTVARAVLALALCALGLNAWAKKSDRKQPMDVTADHSDMSTADDGASTLTGSVVATQGSMVIHADKAVITKKDGDISFIVLTGNPVHLKQDDENGEPMFGTAQRVDDDLIKNVAVFTGNAVIDQPARGQMHGERIVYDMDSGHVTSGGDGSRVSMHIIPKQKPDKPDKPNADAKTSTGSSPAAAPPASTPAASTPIDQPPSKTP